MMHTKGFSFEDDQRKNNKTTSVITSCTTFNCINEKGPP